MVVSKKMKALYNAIFDGTENCVANTIQKIQVIKERNDSMPDEKVPAEYAKRFHEYWKKYGNYSPKWGWFYASRNGIDDVRYIPATLYYTKLDQYFNNKKLGWGFNDKNYYSKIFAGIRQPKVVVRNIGGLFFNEFYEQISLQQAICIIQDEEEVVCKPALESGSARGILFWKGTDKEKYKSFLKDNNNQDYIIQKVIKQHERLKNIHGSSVNTIRISTILMEDGVHILSSCLRMGVGKSRVDNHHAGGMSAGINKDGTLQKYAYYLDGMKMDKHPGGFVFEGYKVPGYRNAIELAKTAHPLIGHFRLVGWDIAIDEYEQAVLIECNMRKNGIELHEFSNGPFFGELTDTILDEVFLKRNSNG